MLTLMGTRWQIAKPPPIDFLNQYKRINPLLVQVLYNRGLAKLDDIKDFLTHQFTGADDPFLLQDMENAVDRIKKAIKEKERIAIYGDYDADGVTGAVLLVQALRAMGAERVQPYIPHRIEEGYGLNDAALEFLAASGNTLIITVDCGVRAVEQVKASASLGLDIIITDHHTVGSEMPPAIAIIDPKRENNKYPDDMLAGVGVAYKLVQGLVRAGIELQEMNETDLLDLVALGTVADMAPLIKENRVLVQQGLATIKLARRPGLAALMNIAGINREKVNASTIGYGIGPRINAAGRMGHAYQAARLLITNEEQEARKMAANLEELNRKRRYETQKLTNIAEELANKEQLDSPLLFAAHQDFPSGIVGLVANRLQEKTYRPAIVAKINEDDIVGSCRSIPEFHITDALDKCKDILVKYGGHAAAAGFTAKKDNIDELKQRLSDLAKEQLEGIDLIPTLNIDAELAVKDIIWEVQETMAELEPCGYGNPTPLFYSPSVTIKNHRKIGSDGAHLKLMIEQDDRPFDGIAFRMGDNENQVKECMDIVYLLEVNEWNGQTSMQLNIQDMRPSLQPCITLLPGNETNIKNEHEEQAMKVCVTGAAGFIGSHLSEALLQRGDHVVGVDNFNDYYDPAIKRANAALLASYPNFKLVDGDIRNRQEMLDLFASEHFDAVAHLAAMAGVRYAVEHPEVYGEVNINGTINLLDGARFNNVKNFVFASTSSVYGDTRVIPFIETDPCNNPLQPYAATKKAAEVMGFSYHHLFDLSFTAVRFFTVYGPRGRPDMMAFKVLDNIFTGREVPLYNRGQMHRDWTFVEDTVAGVVAAIDRPLGYEIINLGRGEPILLSNFIEMLEGLAGRKANLVPAPMMAADVIYTYADISKAQRLLDYRPHVSVQEGVARFWEWYRDSILNLTLEGR